MPIAVVAAAWVTYRPDARLTWIIAMPFFILALMFTLNYDSIHLVAWYGGQELPVKYRFAATWAKEKVQFFYGLHGWLYCLLSGGILLLEKMTKPIYFVYV